MRHHSSVASMLARFAQTARSSSLRGLLQSLAPQSTESVSPEGETSMEDRVRQELKNRLWLQSQTMLKIDAVDRRKRRPDTIGEAVEVTGSLLSSCPVLEPDGDYDDNPPQMPGYLDPMDIEDETVPICASYNELQEYRHPIFISDDGPELSRPGGHEENSHQQSLYCSGDDPVFFSSSQDQSTDFESQETKAQESQVRGTERRMGVGVDDFGATQGMDDEPQHELEHVFGPSENGEFFVIRRDSEGNEFRYYVPGSEVFTPN